MKKLLVTATLFGMVTLAQAGVSISSASFQEQVKVNEKGEKVKAWVKASKVVPGTTIRYVNTLNNNGKGTASKLVVNNPVPENMEYVANSASCQDGCSISYSVDGGKTFKEPMKLFLGVGKNRHLARASEYTNIRWVVSKLDAKMQSSVEYKARLK